MSWLDRIKENIVIVTADGAEHKPLYVNADKLREYNISEFDFDGVSGTYVSRKMPRGAKYNLELVFQGADHLDLAQALDSATASSGEPWSVYHPFYGSLYLQPTAMHFDNTVLNVSRITLVAIETLMLTDVAKWSYAPQQQVSVQASVVADAANNALAKSVVNVNINDRIGAVKYLTSVYTNIAKKVKDSADATRYLNAFNEATGFLNSIGSSTVSVAQGVQQFTALPYTFADAVSEKLNMFRTQYELIVSSSRNLFKRSSKSIMALTGASVVAGAALSTVSNATYSNGGEALDALDGLWGLYRDFISLLDGVSADASISEDSYLPDYDMLAGLAELMSYTHQALVNIISRSRVQRSLVIQFDTSLFELAATLYADLTIDEGVNRLIEDNKLSTQEMYALPQGKTIIYYTL